VEFLRRWSAEEAVDPFALPALVQEHFPGETWERLVLHLGQALDTRLRAWADRLVRAMEATQDEFSAGRTLTQAREGLRPVRALAGHPGLPESLRTRFTDLVDNQIRDLNDQLEHSLDRHATGGSDPRWIEARRRTLRDNALTALLTTPPSHPPIPGAPPPPTPTHDPWSMTPPTTPRRRVITD